MPAEVQHLVLGLPPRPAEPTIRDRITGTQEFTDRRRREDGMSYRDSIVSAAIQRFRPVMLTTLTTFGGLAPMIFETSRQARFLVPMALSLGFGILFATFITLILVPALYMTAGDAARAGHALRRFSRAEGPEPAPSALPVPAAVGGERDDGGSAAGAGGTEPG